MDNKEEEGPSLESGMMIRKSCSICKTTKTPLWRSGPSGPKSLCNACGIRYRKKRPSPPPIRGNNKLQKSRTDGGMTMAFRDESERQWGEVERAALLLMALSSCGRGVFA